MSEKKKEDGLAEEIIESIPGLGGLFKTLKKSPAFKEKMEEINDELERKIKDTPLKKSDLNTSYGFSMGSPGGSRAGGTQEKPFKARKATKKTSVPRKQKDWAVDVFDEEDHLNIIVEMPGVDEKEIKINFENDVLTLSTNNAKRKHSQKIKLPCSPTGEIIKKYKNGILELRVEKK